MAAPKTYIRKLKGPEEIRVGMCIYIIDRKGGIGSHYCYVLNISSTDRRITGRWAKTLAGCRFGGLLRSASLSGGYARFAEAIEQGVYLIDDKDVKDPRYRRLGAGPKTDVFNLLDDQ